MKKIQDKKSASPLVSLYNDLIDTALVLKSMRDSDPNKAVSFEEYKKKRNV
ncbi:MAG: hypothetical protein AB7J40_01175 [Candidatus Altimarinota bacterium]